MEANLLYKTYKKGRIFLLLMILFAFGGNAFSQNYALRFDGSGDYVNTSFAGTHSIWTLEAWVKDDGTQSDYCSIIQTTTSNDNALYIYPNSNGNVLGYWPAGGGTTAVSPNMWTHVAATRGADGVVRYFVNGLPDGSSATAITAINKIQIGGYGTGDPEVFSGIIDEVRIWNYARSIEDIGAYKNIVLTGSESGLLAYWNFNNQNLTDLSGNGFNGTMFGNTAIISSDAPVYANAPGNEAFESVPPTGLPYNIVLSDLTINGSEIPAGTQIGVFDGELCVGTTIYGGSPNQNLVAWQADPSQNLAGFTSGNPMTFKYHAAWHSEIRNFDATKTMVKGNGNFGNGAFSTVNLSVTTSLVPDFAISAEILNFNTVIVNQSKTLPIVFENNGTAVLAISSIQNSNANFTRSENNFWMAPGSKDTLWITFKPTAVTTYSDQLTFNTDDPDFPNMSVPLYGTGLPQPTAQVVVTPSALNFGGISMNTTKTMLLNILNPGNGTLTVTSISSSNPAFTIFGGGSFSLGQGENRDVSVVFSPTQSGVYNGQLSIVNNAQNQSIPLTGIASQGHFTSVAPTGKPYTLVVQDVDIDGFRPLAGDEIAVFDDNLCVGTGVSGQGGNSLLLTGSNGYIINDNSTAFDLQQFTISAWVYSSNFNQNGFIFEKGQVNSQYSLFFENGSINFRTIPTEGGYDDFYVNLATAGIVNNQWNHITVTYNGLQKTLYVNGLVKATQSYSKQIRTGMAGQIIGAYGGNGGHSYYYNGNIDEVRVYNYARSVFEIESDRFHELQGTEPGLVGYWDFNDGNFNNHVPGSTTSYIGGNASLLGVQNSQIFSNLLITAWEKDDALGLPGFTQGNPMTFKVWTEVYDNWVEVAAIPDYVVGNGNFGFGQMSVLSLEGTSGLAPDISVAIESLYVGQVTVGSSVVNTIQVANQGNAPLHFTLSYNSTAFSTSITTGVVPANSTLDFQVTFSPASPGGYSGILTIQSNDPDEPAINIGLEGFALPAGASNIGTSLNILSFGSVVVNSTETLSLIVINTGTTPLTVSSITFNNAAFSATPTSFTLQNTNDLKEVLVTFQPGSKGSFSGIMTINSNAAQKQVSLAGTGFEDHFNVVDPTGLPYNIIVQETNLDGYINPGDELSVFDGDLCVGMVTSFTSMNLKSAKFSGSGSYLQIPNAASLNPSAITVEAWVKTTDAGASKTIVSKTAGCASSGYLIWLNENGVGAGRPGFFIGDGPWLDADIAVNDGQWHHIAGTFDGTTARIYVDGVLRNSRTSAENISSSNPLQIGGSTNCGAYLNGNLDEVKIWNYALSAQQIGQSMNSSLLGNEAGLAGYWSFEDSFGDKSVNNHSTQVVGTTVLEQSAPLLINNQNLNITAWQKDVINGLPGFTTGNPMSFKLWTEINGFATEFTATPTYVVGNGNFGFGQFSVVNLEFDLAGIAVEPSELFVALEEPDSTERTITVTNPGSTALQFDVRLANLAGNVGKSLLLDGSDDYLKVNYNYPNLNEITLEAWIYPTNISGTRYIFSTGRDCCTPTGGFNFYISDGTLSGHVWRSASTLTFGASAANVIKANQWQHVSMTYDGTQVKLFLNGDEVAVSPVMSTSAILNGSNSLHLGVLAYSVPGYYDFAGNIDEVRIWNNALDKVEIKQGLNKILSGSETGLLGYWNFDSGTATDLTVNGRNGVYVGHAAASPTNAPAVRWIEVITSNQVVPSGESINISLDFNSTGLIDGLYGADILISNNTLDNSPIIIPVSMNVTGNPQIAALPPSVAMGQVVVNTSATNNLSLQNIGTKDLIIQNIQVLQGVASGFTFTLDGQAFPITIAPGQSVGLTVTFSPQTPGQVVDTLMVYSNAGNAANFPVRLTGEGITPPEIFIPQTVFTSTMPCNDESDNSLEIFNNGQNNLSVTLVSDQSWLVATPSQATVAGGDSIAVAIAISSLDLYAGLHEATLSVHSNDPEQPVVEVHYSVTITGEPAILCNDFLNIGTAFVGDTLVGQLTVANSGCDVLEVLSVGVQSQFQVFFVNNPNFTVPPGEAAILEIAFVPATTQQYSGIITITSNDPASTTLPVVVSANGVEPPNMTVTPLAITATVPAGSASQKNFLVKNTGGQVLQFNTAVNPVNPYMLRLDGNGDYINVVHAEQLNPSTAITLEAWIFLNDNTNEFIVGKENSTEGKYRFFVNNNHRFEFSLNNAHTVISNAVAAKNLWYHVAATFDGTAMRIFINGLMDAEETFAPFTIQPNTDNLRIGRSYQFAYFNGSIDEIRVWNIARNGSEIQSAMNQSLLGTEPELLLYFPFENATGNIVTDASANSNNGILYGNPVRQSATVPFDDYLTLSNGSGSLTANQQQNVNLGLNPGGFFAQSFARQIAVSSNAVANPSETVSLSLTITGEGNIVPNPGQVQFANTFIGIKDTVELILENTGATAIEITDITFNLPVFYSLNQEHKIFPYSSKKLLLIFEPNLAQSYSGMLTISSGGAKALPVQIPLNGLGVTPPIPVLSPVAANFGPVVVNHTESISMNLSNTGNSALEVYSFSFSDAAFFSSNLQLPVTIAFGQQVQFNISFAPLNYNPISEQMLLNTNIGLVSIPLSGTGVPPDHDLSVTGVLTPENDCGLSASEILKISVKNFGVLPQSNFNVGFSLNNGPVVVETISASLASGNTLIYTFNQTLNLAVVGNYNLEVFTLLGNDQNTWNDTLNKVITNFPSVGNISGLMPADSTFGVVEPVSFSWSPAANATFYDLYLWRTNQPKPVSPTVSGITTTHYTYTDYLNKNYLYNWQLVARNQCSESESAIQLFAFNVFSDLIVSEITAPANANSGEFIDISFKISNIGTGGTGIIPWKDDIYISLSPTFDVNTAVKVATVNNLTALNQGQHYFKTVNIKLSDYLEGEFYVFVKTDANNIIQETDENNNFLRSETTMAVGLPPYPDLTVSNIQSLSGNIIPGQTLTVGWSIDNIGDTIAVGGWSQRVAIVAGTQLQILGYVQSSDSLDPATSISQSSSFAIPQQLGLEGDVFLQVRITPNAGLVEKPNGDVNNTVLSDESVLLEKRLTVFIPQPTLAENAANPYNCMIYRSGSPAQPLVVNLSVSLENRIAIPATVTIPSNQSGAPFSLSAIDNNVIEGNINLVITAATNGFPNSTANLTIIDNEVPSLQISLNKTEASEGETFQLTVTRDLVTGNALNVSLFTLKPNQITLPANILIEANQASATLDVAVVNNTVPELTENVVVNATVAGYLPASAGISIIDDDLPQITFTINPATVSESGGPYASWGTVQLSQPAVGNVVVIISAATPNQVFFPSQVTISNGQYQQQFNIGIIDNGILDGDRVVEISAAVYISSCGCGAPPETGGAASQNITILDNDGPSLSVSSNPFIIPESLVNAGVLTITRNTLGGAAITVSIQHNGSDEIVIPETAIIPEGATSVNVPFNTLDDGIEDGDQIVTITVTSLDYSSGSCWVIVSDRNLPDYVAKNLVLSQSDVLIGDPVQISLKIANEGFSLAADGAEVKIYRSDDNSISTSDVLLSTQYTQSVLNIGDSTEITFTYTPIDKIGNFFIIANVNANGAKNELLAINNTTQALPFAILPDYQATASVAGDVFNGTAPIIITGVTETVVKSPAPNKPVDVYIVVNGVRRVMNTVSDATGAFSLSFFPLNGEAGEYFVGACYPGQNLNVAQDQFTILGARHTATGYILWDLWLNETKPFFLEIQNFSDLELTNLQLDVLSGPPGCVVNFVPIAQLPGSSLATMSYTINATQVTAGTQYEEVKLQLTSAEGTKFKFSAWFYSKATKGNLKLNPVVLTKAMVRGITNYAEFEVLNNGLDETGVISILLPQNNWMSLASVSQIPSLLPGESAIVTLRLTPGDDLQLNNPITGQIALSGTNSNSVGLSFSFEPVSLETGDFLVDVVDEYTYNTEAAPHLAGATVVISHPYTGQIITQGITDVNGHFLADDVNEGYYNLKVTAPQHGNFQDLIYIEKGVTTTKVVFIAFQAITYSWEVVPTMIEDEYEITLVAVFETNVPAPVVEMSMPDTMPQLNYGEVFPFILIMTNHGLITAQDVEVTFPQDDEYEFIANVSTLDILPQSAVQIPVIMQKRPPQSSANRSTNCQDFTVASYKFECGPDDQMRIVQDDVYYQGRYCGGSGTGGGGWGWCYDCGGYGPGGPGGGYTGPVFPIEIPTAPYQQSKVGCDPCLADFLNALWGCSPIPNIGIGKGGISSVGSKMKNVWKKLKPLKELAGKLECAFNIGWSLGCKINQAIGGKGPVPAEIVQAQADLFMVDKGFTATGNITHEIYDNESLMQRQDFVIFNDSVLNNIELIIPIDEIRVNELLGAFTNSDIPQDEILGFVDRWNTSMEAYDLGVYSPNPDFQNIIDTLLIYNYSLSYDTAYNYAIDRGYSSIEEMYNEAYAIVEGYTDETSSSVCATVTVQFSQQLTMTREAFEGTLTIFNGHDTDAMENIMLDLEIRDQDGFIRNDLFQINTLALNQITGIDGSGALTSQTEGTAVVQFIPERGAAPNVPVYYDFGGTLSYLDPFTGEIFEQPLFPVTLQVNPSPNLFIDYFMQRDILGDDALTEPIEPMIPAELAVMIDNQGAGTAYSVNIESAQPEIIENEKGLLIDFEIVGSNLSGKPTQLGLLNVNFGDIEGGKIGVGQWWFTSTLLGHFISYEVKINHLSSFGNPDLSLVSDVQVHELIKSVSVYGPLNDSINDFLVNDVPDTDDIPDALYYSTGIVAPVAEADDSETDGPVSISDLSVELTLTPSETGWNYTRLDDPGNGFFRIVSCTREDGQEIPLENIWLTYVTIPDGGEPNYENKLHFLDTFDDLSPKSYTVVFEPVDQNFPEVVAINGIPAGVTDTPVTNVEVVFSKPIDPATYTYEDMTLKNQGGPNLMDPSVIVSQLNDTTFNVDISTKTSANGFYMLTVQAAGITDLIGNPGQTGKQASWIQAISTPAIDYFFGLPETPGEPIDTLLVLFNMPINVSTFTKDQLVLTDGEDNPISTNSLVITPESFNNVLFKISGLLPLTSSDGMYKLTFKVTEIQGETGLAGLLDQTVEWTVCQIPLPFADAGDDDSVCIGESHQLNGTVQNQGSFIWTTSGTGTFDDDQFIAPVYTASQDDINNGTVIITLTAQPLNACAAAAISSLTLTIKNAVEANAGDDATICQNTKHQLFGTITNANSGTWITAGDGSFNNSSILTPVYNPGAEDIANGYALLSLVAEPQSPCVIPDTSSMLLTIQKLPTAYAGANQTVCEDDQVQLQGVVQNSSSIYWFGGADGIMNDRTIANPVYIFGAADIERGYVSFLLTAQAANPCFTRAFSTVRINVNKAPVVIAGADETICENQVLQLNGSVQNQSSFIWQTSGDGTFSNPNILNPVYVPGSADITNLTVQLSLTAQPLNPCQNEVTVSKTLNIMRLPVVDAGQDGLICESESYQLNGSVSNVAAILWQTSGDGTFSNTQIVNPVYTPGASDILNNGAELLLLVNPVYPCPNSISSSLNLVIQQLPSASAGDDAVICHNQTYLLTGSVNNTQLISWSTSGDGSFDHQELLAATYTPGANDVLAGNVTLTLVAEANTPCTLSAQDEMNLVINYCHDLVIPSGWSGISTFVEPVDAALETIFGDVINDLTILYSQTGVFWPGQNLNTIGEWNRLDGYTVKVSSQIDLRIAGSRSASRTLQLSQGWNLIPVLSECEAEVISLFAGTGVVVVKEIAGWKLYWPTLNINTLGSLQSGKAYYVLMSQPATVTFGDCPPGALAPGKSSVDFGMEEMINAAPWEIAAPTASSHIIGIAKEVINSSLIKTGDYLGAFDESGQCYGLVRWEGKSTTLTAFSDDPTTSVKDGFTAAETMYIRLFVETTSQEYNLEISWDEAWPQSDGSFNSTGLSAISGFKLGATQIYEQGAFEVLIYPNPANSVIFIDFTTTSEISVSLNDVNGREVLRQTLSGLRNQLDISALRSGVYFMKLEGNGFVKIEKIIKQ